MSERISFDEAVDLFKNAPLEELKLAAQKIRNKKNPLHQVSFVLDSNPNYTNVCSADCTFCAFYRKKSAKDAYTKSIEEVMQVLEDAQKAGLTTVLLQGGLNDDLPLDYYVTLVKEARRRYPNINPHFFTAPEIWNIARISKCSTREVLQALYDAGQRSLPGGGSEILSEKVRLKVSPKKMEKDGWINIHEEAHQIGFISTATMMYGHIEEPEDIVLHLETIRNLQDKHQGFTAFIPWSYKRTNTALRRKVKNWAGEDAYFRILSFARIYLDNFKHIQASWFGEGKEIGMEALHYGADDFGGTIIEENVHRATNFINKTDHNGMLEMIRKSGFEPVQRNTYYDIIRNYEGINSVSVPHEGQIKEKDILFTTV
ncbi:Cyclic dehypoxanthine futalosine synthase [Chlamydiales bacterium SCGC AB-751-O23]|nr:Cyclic dehypoxanthine futalosine synthase [Chlamydiales bacterium SCGC AB-751-O23]